MNIQIELEQDWDSLESAIAYFKSLITALEALKGFPDMPGPYYLTLDSLDVYGNKINIDSWTLAITNQ